MTQWLIGIFVRFLSSKDDLINCAGVGRLKRFGEPFQLFYFTEFFPTPFLLLIAWGCKSTNIAMSDSVGIATDLVVGVSFNGMNDSV